MLVIPSEVEGPQSGDEIICSILNLTKPLARILDPSALVRVTAIEKMKMRKEFNPSPAILWQSPPVVVHA